MEELLSSRDEAQLRVEQIHAFKSEQLALQNAGVFKTNNEDSQTIDNYHQKLLSQLANTFDIDISTHSKQLTLGMKFASFFGALAMALSIFFLFYQFWGLMDTPLQVTSLISAPIILFILTMYLARDDKNSYFSKISALVTFASFVLNLSMLGQIFNISASPNAFIVWAAFGFVLAYACNARLLVFFAIVCLSSFIAMKTGTYSGMYWISFGERPENFFIPALIVFFIPQLFSHKQFSGFSNLYRVMAMLLTFIPILILANWGVISYLSLDRNLIEGGYQTLGFGLSAAAIWLGIKHKFNEVVNTGNVFFVLFLYTKLFDWWWEWMPKYIFFFLIGLVAILALVVFKRLRLSQLNNKES